MAILRKSLWVHLNAQQKHFDELRELVDDDYWGAPRTQKTQKKSVLLPKEFKPLWNGENSVIKTHALSYLHKRGISKEDIREKDKNFIFVPFFK